MTDRQQQLTSIAPAPPNAQPGLIRPAAFNAFLEASRAAGSTGSTGGAQGVMVDPTGTYFRTPRRADVIVAEFSAELYKWERVNVGTQIPFYLYGFREVEFDLATRTYAELAGGQHGDISGTANPDPPTEPNNLFAINKLEARNVESGTQGTGVDTSQDYPANFNHLPLGGATATDGEIGDSGVCNNLVVVPLKAAVDKMGLPYFWFALSNADYGSCA